MGFAQQSGYTPQSIATMMLSVMEGYNEQFGTSYTAETFIGTNAYKYFYALLQQVQESEVKTSEIFIKLQAYFRFTNERISRPVVTNPGLIERFDEAGYLASVKKMILADAGQINICVDADDGDHATGSFTITSYANLVSGTDDSVGVGGVTFTAQAGAATPGATTFQAATSNAATAISLAAQINAHTTTNVLVKARALGALVKITALHGGTAGNAIALAYTDNDTNVGATKTGTVLSGGTAQADYTDTKLAIATIIKDSTVAVAVTVGDESQAIVLTNGQSFDFKYHLPEKIDVLLKLTTVLSENNEVVILTPDEIKQLLIANITARYSLGKNFEPQRYFSTVDAPWASSVTLEWSDDAGGVWHTTVYDSDFDEVFLTPLANITLVES